METSILKKTAQQQLFLVASAIAFLAFCWYFSNIVVYVIVAWVLSIVLRPMYCFIRLRFKYKRYLLPKGLSVLLCFAVLVGGLFLLGYMFVPVIIKQANQLSKVDFNALAQKVSEPLVNLDAQAHNLGLLQPEQNLSSLILSQLKGLFNPGNIGLYIQNILGTAGSFIAGLVAVLFITFFFLIDDRMFTYWIKAIVPMGKEVQARHVVQDGGRMLSRYFAGILLQMLFVTFFLWIGLLIFGIKNALLIAFFGAIMNVIPYLGPILGAVFGVLMTITSNIELAFYPDITWLCVKTVAVFSAMQMVDNIIVSPLIFSRSVQAHPLEIFLVVLISAQIGGVFGMLIAIPVYTMIRVVARIFLSEFRIVKSLTSGLDEALDPSAENN